MVKTNVEKFITICIFFKISKQIVTQWIEVNKSGIPNLNFLSLEQDEGTQLDLRVRLCRFAAEIIIITFN